MSLRVMFEPGVVPGGDVRMSLAGAKFAVGQTACQRHHDESAFLTPP